MIDWGDTPVGSEAQIYWPEVPAADVLALATRLYGTHLLSAAGSETIAFKSVKGATYIPIPEGAGKQFAGLFTVDLPLGVRTGQEFNILVRRISTREVIDVVREGTNGLEPTAAAAPTRKWRYITGAFQVKIPVTGEDVLLGPEENTLAILKARLDAMAPKYRWYPVLKRYIEYVAGRVDGAGGNAGAIQPSLTGVPHRHHEPEPEPEHRREREHARTGKVSGLIFDRFGDFEGFLLDGGDREIRFLSREREMKDLTELAWRERLRITVWSDEDDPHHPLSVVIHDPPVSFGH